MDTPSNKFCRIGLIISSKGLYYINPSSLLTYLILETVGQSTIIGDAELFVIRNINIPASITKILLGFVSITWTLGHRDTATTGVVSALECA